MNNVIRKIRNRLPGGYNFYDVFRGLLGYRYAIRNNYNSNIVDILKYNYLNRLSIYIYKKSDYSNKITESFCKEYIKDDVINFGTFKLVKENSILNTITFEYMCIILPEMLDNFDFGLEGPYEKFGVNIEKDDVVFDVGANIGIFTCFAVEKGARVHAFEPSKRELVRLNKNIELNNCTEQVKVVDRGISNKQEKVDFQMTEGSGGGTMVMEVDNPLDVVEIDMTTIDAYVAENNIKKLDLIKADIEGAERIMLEGAKNTLKTLKPKLAICTYHLPDDKKVLTRLIKEANPEYEIKYTKRKLYAK